MNVEKSQKSNPFTSTDISTVKYSTHNPFIKTPNLAQASINTRYDKSVIPSVSNAPI